MAASDVMNREVLFKHRELQTNLSNQIAAIKSGDHDIDRILNQLEAIQTNATSIGDFLSCIVPCKFYNEHRAGTSTIAEKALHIPELLEMILEHCDILDVARMLQTCNGVRAIIEASPKLQTKLLLRPEGDLDNLVDNNDRARGEFITHPHERCENLVQNWARVLQRASHPGRLHS